MPVFQGGRGARRVLLPTAAAAALAAGGTGVAFAASAGSEPVESGYAVVETAVGPDPQTSEECDKGRAGGTPGDRSPEESTPSPSGGAPAEEQL